MLIPWTRLCLETWLLWKWEGFLCALTDSLGSFNSRSRHTWLGHVTFQCLESRFMTRIKQKCEVYMGVCVCVWPNNTEQCVSYLWWTGQSCGWGRDGSGWGMAWGHKHVVWNEHVLYFPHSCSKHANINLWLRYDWYFPLKFHRFRRVESFYLEITSVTVCLMRTTGRTSFQFEYLLTSI